MKKKIHKYIKEGDIHTPMIIDNVPESMSKINQLSATFIQEKKISGGQKLMIYCHGEIFREKSMKNSGISEIVFMCSGD